MEELVVNHFKNLLMEPYQDRENVIGRFIQHIPWLVSQEQNMPLMWEVTLIEVEEIVKGKEKNKALRLDGFIVEFYQAA